MIVVYFLRCVITNGQRNMKWETSHVKSNSKWDKKEYVQRKKNKTV